MIKLINCSGHAPNPFKELLLENFRSFLNKSPSRTRLLISLYETPWNLTHSFNFFLPVILGPMSWAEKENKRYAILIAVEYLKLHQKPVTRPSARIITILPAQFHEQSPIYFLGANDGWKNWLQIVGQLPKMTNDKWIRTKFCLDAWSYKNTFHAFFY